MYFELGQPCVALLRVTDKNNSRVCLNDPKNLIRNVVYYRINWRKLINIFIRIKTLKYKKN